MSGINHLEITTTFTHIHINSVSSHFVTDTVAFLPLYSVVFYVHMYCLVVCL